MASHNEVYKYLAQALLRNDLEGHEGEVAQSSNGTMFLRLRDQVFKITLAEVDAISEHPQAETEARRFMSTQPYPYTLKDFP